MPGLLNGLSSISAFALAQPGPQVAGAIATLVAIGAVAAGALTVITYKQWEKYEEKKHKEKMEAINQLHKLHLKNITIVNGTSIPGFPLIFQFSQDNKTVDSLHYNEDEVKDIGNILPDVPVLLTRYRQYVLDALLKLKEYYFDLSKKDDVTAGVLSYLLNVIQNRCLSFAGYDYDIAYLHALIAFINAYASQENTEHSQHFDRLKPVYTSLMNAVQDLEKHKESMSLHELVEQARNACLDESNKLLRLLVRMVVPEKYDSIVDTVTYKELEQDILRQKYIDAEIWGIVLKSRREIDLPRSIFHNWIMGMAKYFLQSQNPRVILKGEPIIHPNELFAFLNWAKEVQAQPKPIKENNPEYKKQEKTYQANRKKLHNDLDLIHRVFTRSPNFINTRLEGPEKDKKFVVIKEDNELLAAADVMAKFTHLIHGIISLQGLCAELSNSMEQLGLDFFDDQNNFNKIFAAFNAIYSVIQADLREMKRKMVEISVANENTMRIAYKLQFQNQVNKALEAVEFRVLTLADKVRLYKNKHPKTIDDSVKEALSAAEFFQKLYEITPPSQAGTENTSRPQESPQKTDQATQTKPLPPQTEEKIPDQPTFEQMDSNLMQLGNELSAEVANIGDGRYQDPQHPKYETIYNVLISLQVKSIEMLKEEGQSPDRLNKAHNLYKLTVSLYKTTIEFLSLIPDDREKKVDAFVNNIHGQLNNQESNAFIDRHNRGISKFIQDNFGFFPTNTRKRVSALEFACESLRP